MEGYRHTDPDREGLVSRHWAGTAKLRIEAAAPSTVWLWGEDLEHDPEAGEDFGLRVTGVPDRRSNAWSATLSTEAGEKGYFSFDDDQGRQIRGQFEAADQGTTPTRVIGHFRRDGHSAVFDATRP